MSEIKKIRVKPTFFVLCDDVRTESTGKTMLIGIYTGGINLEGPITLRPDGKVRILPLSFWMPIDANESGGATIEIQAVAPGNKRTEMKIDVAIEKIKERPEGVTETVFITSKIPIPIVSGGNLQIKFRNEGDAEWQNLATYFIKIQNTGPTVSTETMPLSEQSMTAV